MSRRELIAWVVAGVVGLALVAWVMPRLEPFTPTSTWTVSRAEAETIAREAIRELGADPDALWVGVERYSDEPLQLRLLEASRAGIAIDDLRASRLAEPLAAWRATFHDPAETAGLWRARAVVGLDGRVLSVRRWWTETEGAGGLESGEAIVRARKALEARGVDLSLYQAPTVRVTEVGERRDTTVRFEDTERVMGEALAYGLEVRFAGSEYAGMLPYVDDPEAQAIRARFQAIGLTQQAWVFLPILLLPLFAIPFVRRYHAGEIGIAQGLRLAGVVLAGGIVACLFTARGVALGWNFGVLTKPQTMAVIFVQFAVVFYVPMALLSFLSWSVGESFCRQRRPQALAAFDALFKRDWANATYARAAVRGIGSGVALSALMLLAAWGLMQAGVIPFEVGSGGTSWESAQWWILPVLGFAVAAAMSVGLMSELLLTGWIGRHFGRTAGVIGAALIATIATFPAYFATPVWGTLLVAFVINLALIGVFLRWGILSSLLARMVVNLLPLAWPLTLTTDPSIRWQAFGLLAVLGLPVALGARWLFSNRELIYRWEDIPPHVRRIAERERQKVELETARNIQASILPELPPELNGVETAHAYQPASEVGGDFYDVLALEDGRIAVAVGDVAGHGVSSGLVMSMAKSALAVQVTFDPEVDSVFRTLNRMVYQGARRRLLTTLVYALVDPVRRELFWASAGHLFPYRIGRDGVLSPLESVAYPLGVRRTLEVRTRRIHLDPGDLLFLFSDGVVEARAEGSQDLWGFERLEQSLERHAAMGSATALRDGVLRDLRAFVGSDAPLEDDLTVLALRMPG